MYENTGANGGPSCRAHVFVPSVAATFASAYTANTHVEKLSCVNFYVRFVFF